MKGCLLQVNSLSSLTDATHTPARNSDAWLCMDGVCCCVCMRKKQPRMEEVEESTISEERAIHTHPPSHTHTHVLTQASAKQSQPASRAAARCKPPCIRA